VAAVHHELQQLADVQVGRACAVFRVVILVPHADTIDFLDNVAPKKTTPSPHHLHFRPMGTEMDARTQIRARLEPQVSLVREAWVDVSWYWPVPNSHSHPV
jgi:hypothetical protein